MTTSNFSTASRETTPHAAAHSQALENDAAAWADVLNDWLGPENDVYSWLLQRGEQDKRKTKLSS
jgi:hypothetical protein